MIRVSVFNAHPRTRIRKAPVRRAVRRVLRGEGVQRASVDVVFIDRHYCRRINRRFLGHDTSTDVISFPLEADRLEGEVYINLDRARRQAREYGVSAANEIARLVIHGTLHLAGYDDMTERTARAMRRKEDAALVSLTARG